MNSLSMDASFDDFRPGRSTASLALGAGSGRAVLRKKPGRVYPRPSVPIEASAPTGATRRATGPPSGHRLRTGLRWVQCLRYGQAGASRCVGGWVAAPCRPETSHATRPLRGMLGDGGGGVGEVTLAGAFSSHALGCRNAFTGATFGRRCRALPQRVLTGPALKVVGSEGVPKIGSPGLRVPLTSGGAGNCRNSDHQWIKWVSVDCGFKKLSEGGRSARGGRRAPDEFDYRLSTRCGIPAPNIDDYRNNTPRDRILEPGGTFDP